MATFDELFTFTRSTTGTYYDIGGVLQTAAIDEPRFTYDPDTNSAEGLLIEESRTNLFQYSEEINNAAWPKTNVSVTTDAASAPDGALTGDKIIGDVGATTLRFRQTVSLTSGETYTYSVYAKAGEYSTVQTARNSLIIDAFTHDFDLVAETATGGGNIQKVGGGWYRLSGSFVCNTTGTSGPIFDIEPGATGDGTSGLFFWGGQLEEGSNVNSYIKTEGAQVVRSADSCSRTLGQEFNRVACTIYWQGFVETPVGGSRGVCLIKHPAQTNAGFGISISSAGDIQLGLRDPDSGTGSVASLAKPAGLIKAAVSVQGSQVFVALNGVSVDESGAYQFDLQDFSGQLILGGSEFLIGGVATEYGPQLNESVVLLPRALSLTELEALTS